MSARTEITSNAMAYLSSSINESFDFTEMVGDFADDFDMEALAAEYRTTVEQIVQRYRPDWVIAGDFIYGDYPAEYLTEDERQDLIDELDMIDINAILEHHDNTPRADA